ncbi:hypothetical protein C2G38_2183932 [Gigaspora rosea]|uniref:Uncharacterized protein n=1 Tax=Gigaspora rosea TaxID=44941 RepID=A0A397VBI1_9GLOM|nr:hypothetical protein C2G38_2183932 [Gigaspora rosea]
MIHISQGLTTNIAANLEEIRRQNQINLNNRIDNYENVTTLLELSGTTRYETNAAIVDALKKVFIKAIEKENWDNEKDYYVLARARASSHYFALLKKYPKRMTEEIYEILAQELAKKPDIIHVIINMDRVNLSEAPIGIKRGLYERNNTILKEFIYSQFSKYLQKRETNLDRRMNDLALKTIIDLIDKNQILFAELQVIVKE